MIVMFDCSVLHSVGKNLLDTVKQGRGLARADTTTSRAHSRKSRERKNEAHSSHGAVLRDGPLAPAKITFSFLYAKQT